ncbi:hypothetical protein CASFOL_030020 [Castilleja foliolosa]|uniref:C2H2-type domain-containing protein n=1 Tax=Castilleja foliolosa TaxID=1961234 RepID=A0ABD3CBL5_9LAMI
MARSWDELNLDQSARLLLESLRRSQTQETPIACRLCDKIFPDNRSLLTHFQGHCLPDGSFHSHSFFRNTVPQFNHSPFLWPFNARNHNANANLGSARPSTLVWRDPPVSALLNNPFQFSGHALTQLHQPCPATWTFRGPESRVPVETVILGDLGPSIRLLRDGHTASDTMPFIMQLEKPIEEVVVDVIDVEAYELDLELKL